MTPCYILADALKINLILLRLLLTFAEVTFVDAVKGSGRICPDVVIEAIRPSTFLITVMLANNETGIVQVGAVTQYFLVVCSFLFRKVNLMYYGTVVTVP